MGKPLEEALLHVVQQGRDWMLAAGPGWLKPVSLVVWDILLSVFALYIALETYTKCRKVILDLLPRFSEAERKRNRQRRKFCAFLRSQIEILNQSIRWSDASAWRDDNYVELEAEIEVEGARTTETVFGWLLNRGSGLRREKSLTIAIKRTRERLVVLEGDAGAGKTVALRHVVSELAKQAELSRSNQRLIAIYVNLKTLERSPQEKVDSALIESHVLRAVNESGYTDVKEFVTEELTRGLAEGSLVLLFDSFDEIPEILSATDANDAIHDYGVAIDAFIGRMGAAKGIVASRPFRGPKRLGACPSNLQPRGYKRNRTGT